MMLYFLWEYFGWVAFYLLILLVIGLISHLYIKLSALRRDLTQLQSELAQFRRQQLMSPSSQSTSAPMESPREAHSALDSAMQSSSPTSNLQPSITPTTPKPQSTHDSLPASASTLASSANVLVDTQATPLNDESSSDQPLAAQVSPLATAADQANTFHANTFHASTSHASTIEPDERSLPVVTSLFYSLKHWFTGGNLVVRVGVVVLLVGVVLLLRLLSDYLQLSIGIKLGAVGVIGIALAGLGLKLAKKRFAYGISLQGTGLAIAYLSSFFAYRVYQVLPSFPSFILLGLLSALTVILAIRQNAFPLALLAFSGAFFAPILTSTESGSLVALFGYYLLLNTAIAIIAHYRTWKVLNLLGAITTFGFAYYLGISNDLTSVIHAQRWPLVTLVALHIVLYLFVVIRYAQQIIAYNINQIHHASAASATDAMDSAALASESATTSKAQLSKNQLSSSSPYVFPIDVGLLFSVPIMAFGLLAVLLADIEHALTLTSAILAGVYLSLSWVFIQRSQRYSLMTEGMLALGLGFLALIIPLALDAHWIASGWSMQGLALVWFGRRSLRAWSVLFGLLLQIISVCLLFDQFMGFDASYHHHDYYTLALSMSALGWLASMFILRMSNAPAAVVNQATRVTQSELGSDSAATASRVSDSAPATTATAPSSSASIASYARSLGVLQGSDVHTHTNEQWLASINQRSRVFKWVWRSPALIQLLTLASTIWLMMVLVRDLDNWLASWSPATSMLIALATLLILTAYWLIDRYQSWSEVRGLSHFGLLWFYLLLVIQIPQKYESHRTWMTPHWLLLASLIIGWGVIGQLWLKAWHQHRQLKRYDSACWLGAGVLLIAGMAHYCLPNSYGVMTIFIPVALMLIGIAWELKLGLSQPIRPQGNLTATSLTNDEHRRHGLLSWFNGQQALIDSSGVFLLIGLLWALISNLTFDGVVWGMRYVPLLNLYDIALLLTLLYGGGIYLLHRRTLGRSSKDFNTLALRTTGQSGYRTSSAEALLVILGIMGFWMISSMLVRTLHAYAGTPLWAGNYGNAWDSDKVQTGLTILWTMIALIATILASRYKHRLAWFMGIGLLGVVVLKLVLVDLSQTVAIWRVVSFIGAGSLILLIGYLAPLPPAQKINANHKEENEADKLKGKQTGS